MDEKVICQICGCEILEEKSWKTKPKKLSRESIVYCKGCGTPHHNDCWNMTGMCSTYGCNCKVASPERLHSHPSELIVIEDSTDDYLPVMTSKQTKPVLTNLPDNGQSVLWSFLTKDLSYLIPDFSRATAAIAFALKAYAFPGYILWELIKLIPKKNRDLSIEGCLIGFLNDLFGLAIIGTIFLIGSLVVASGLAIPALFYLATAPISGALSKSLSSGNSKLRGKERPVQIVSSTSPKHKKHKKRKKHKKSKKRKRR